MYHFHKCMLPSLRTWHVILPGFFIGIKVTVLLPSLIPRRDGIKQKSSCSYATHRRGNPCPELNSWTYVEVICPAFHPNWALLRRVFLLIDDKSKYVSVEFYPAKNCRPLVEFEGVKLLPMVLTFDCVALMAERLPSRLEFMCQNEQYQYRSDDSLSNKYHRII